MKPTRYIGDAYSHHTKKYWIIVGKAGKPITTDHKLPIYWLKKIAVEDMKRFGGHEVIPCYL